MSLPRVASVVYLFFHCLSSSFRYAFTILSNVGVFSAMFILLEFVHVGTYHPGGSGDGMNSTTSASTISPKDLWIFSVSAYL